MNYLECNNKIAFHPGYYIEELLLESRLTQEEFASHLGTTPEHLNALIQGNEHLSIDIANRLSKTTKTSINYWLNLQNTYDAIIAQKLREA